MDEEKEFENIWARYGLKDTPYNTKALSLIGTLEIDKVFFGRKDELKLLGDRIYSNNSTRTAIVGEIGTGKTTFANYLRWKLCRKKTIKESKFLTTINEIKIRGDWTFNKFLRETLFEIYDSSKIFKWEEEGISLEILKTIKNNLDIFKRKNIEISESEIKLGLKGDELKQDISTELLQSWFYKLCEEIKGYNKKLILHYNNLESMSQNELGNLFMSIKEIIQIENTHWLFLGATDILSTIENISQVHSIFNQHIILKSLSEKEIFSILELRCEFLSGEGTKYIKPYDEKIVSELYRKLNGNIRFIFKLFEDTTSYLCHKHSSPCIVNIEQINVIQEKAREEILAELTENQKKIIITLMDNKEMTIGELADKLNIKNPQNLSKEIQKLKKKTLITIKENPDDKRSKIINLSEKTYLSFIFSKKD